MVWLRWMARTRLAFANPPLTAVEIPWYDMLAMGTRLLIDLIEHRPPIERIRRLLFNPLGIFGSTRAKECPRRA